MKPDDFRNKVLGPWSSHPYWARRRCIVSALGAVAALGILAGVGTRSGMALLGGSPRLATVLGMVLAFGVSATVWTAIYAWLEGWILMQDEHKSLQSQLGDRLRRMIGRDKPSRLPGGPTPPEWLHELQESLGTAVGKVGRIRLGENETSPDSPHINLKYIFGVPVPTTDQVRLLERFRDFYRRLVERVESDVEACADLLVQGNPGSGKTTALLACAVYAAFVRGQRVLFLVPDTLRQEAVRDRIDLFLKKLHLNYYMKTGVLSNDAVDRWLGGAEPIPHIIIGTLRAAEEHFYGFQCPRDRIPQLRRLVLLPEVVIVDDFMDFDDAQRSHLPFLIDKQRLLLAAEYMPMQVVVSCRKLTELGEEILGKRLFTVKHLDKNRNVLSIRPRQGTHAWRVRLPADNVPETVDKLVTWCLRRGLDVVLYRHGIDEDEREMQQAALAAKGKGRIAVLSDLERPLTSPDPMDVDAIFYHEALHEDICLALRMHAGNEETVIFSVEPSGAKKEVVAGIVPVVADRSATPLLVAHLNSVLRFLKPFTPIHADVWSKFGMEYHTVAEPDRDTQLADDWLELDLWEEQDYRVELGSYISMGKPNLIRDPVKVFALPDPSWAVYRRADGFRLLVGRSAATRSAPGDRRHAGLRRGRLAKWFDREAEFGEVGQVDLAHAYRFKLLLDRRSIGLRTVQQERDGSIKLISEVWHGSGSDRYLPIYDFSWTLPVDQRAERFWGSVDDELRWFELRTDGPGVEVRTQIIGHMSEYAEVTDIPAVMYEFPATLCGLVLRPTPLEQDTLATTIGAALQGPWTIGGDARFWTSLSGAFNYAVRVKVPGLHYFARVVAFELSDIAARVGSAVVWFIEPTSGGRTASQVMANLLQHPKERDDFLRSVQWFLEQLAANEIPPTQFIRQLTHIGLKADDRVDCVDKALTLIRDVRSRSPKWHDQDSAGKR